MKILVSPDKFKGSLTAWEVSQAIIKGLALADNTFICHSFPLADGGEGSFEVLTRHFQGEFIYVWVYDPLFRWIKAGYGWDDRTQTAFMEMSQASGVEILSREERNCYYTSTYGTGQMIFDAYQRGAKKIVIGIGGSATCDGGIGMAQALGYTFLDNREEEIFPIGRNLALIDQIKTPPNLRALKESLQIVILSDVSNYLYGTDGAAYVYGPQKGANESEIESLDVGLRHLAVQMEAHLGVDVHQLEGGGAAGGLGAGLFGFLNGKMERGASWIADTIDLEEIMSTCDWVITGEGKIDQQTSQGKVVKYVCDIARKYQIPVAALCGTSELDIDMQKMMGIDYVRSIVNRPMTLEQAVNDAYSLLEYASFNLGKILQIKINNSRI